ncbi:hypothetical protein C8Q80DRAFT_1149994 [Daedaleopsis nitida]|nr:hypothetical protein C8Q80DRAFT_1149994 [Daedaleopsis nitida]
MSVSHPRPTPAPVAKRRNPSPAHQLKRTDTYTLRRAIRPSQSTSRTGTRVASASSHRPPAAVRWGPVASCSESSRSHRPCTRACAAAKRAGCWRWPRLASTSAHFEGPLYVARSGQPRSGGDDQRGMDLLLDLVRSGRPGSQAITPLRPSGSQAARLSLELSCGNRTRRQVPRPRVLALRRPMQVRRWEGARRVVCGRCSSSVRLR